MKNTIPSRPSFRFEGERVFHKLKRLKKKKKRKKNQHHNKIFVRNVKGIFICRKQKATARNMKITIGK